MRSVLAFRFCPGLITGRGEQWMLGAGFDAEHSAANASARRLLQRAVHPATAAAAPAASWKGRTGRAEPPPAPPAAFVCIPNARHAPPRAATRALMRSMLGRWATKL